MAAQPSQANPQMIAWAIDESGYGQEELAQQLHVDAAKIAAWIDGEESPTVGELSRLSKVLHRSSALFYRPSPPTRHSLPAALRVAQGRAARELLPNERLVLRRARRQQQLVASLLHAENTPQIPKAADTQSPPTAAQRLRGWIGVPLATQVAWKSDREAYRAWKSELEERGLMVMELSLGRQGLRGFSLPNAKAPAISVNSANNYAARSFTLWHEVAHLALATEASCLAPDPDPSARTERWCDRVASAVLMPPDAVRAFIEDERPLGGFQLVERGARHFRVSLRAMAIALEEAAPTLGALFAEVEARAGQRDYEKGGGGGRRRPQIRLQEVGSVGARTIADAVSAQRISELTARRVLRLDGYELSEMAGMVGRS